MNGKTKLKPGDKIVGYRILEDNGVNPVWKTLAIIFIVIFIIETIFFVWVWNVGKKIIKHEDKCAAICGADIRYGIYSFDSFNYVCYCVTPENKYVVQDI